MKLKQDAGIVMVPLDLIDFDEDNPQEQDPATFNDLVDSMSEDGILHNAVLRPNGDRYICVSGEHRVKAAKLAGPPAGPFKTMPSKIVTTWDKDAAAVRLIRMNAIQGKADPRKFTELYNRLAKQYDPDVLRKMLGFSGRDSELRRLIKETASSMPERMQEELEKRADSIRSVEDLAATVQSIYTRYGSTIDRHFVVFSYGGQSHMMVRCSPATFAPIEKLAARAESEGKQFDTVLAEVVSAAIAEGVPA